MINFSWKTVLLALLTSAMIAAVIFAAVFVIEEHTHDCTGDHCHICLEMQIAQMLIEAFGRFGAGMALTGFIVYTRFLIKPRKIYCLLNPIALKVKCNC